MGVGLAAPTLPAQGQGLPEALVVDVHDAVSVGSVSVAVGLGAVGRAHRQRADAEAAEVPADGALQHALRRGAPRSAPGPTSRCQGSTGEASWASGEPRRAGGEIHAGGACRAPVVHEGHAEALDGFSKNGVRFIQSRSACQ